MLDCKLMRREGFGGYERRELQGGQLGRRCTGAEWWRAAASFIAFVGG